MQQASLQCGSRTPSPTLFPVHSCPTPTYIHFVHVHVQQRTASVVCQPKAPAYGSLVGNPRPHAPTCALSSLSHEQSVAWAGQNAHSVHSLQCGSRTSRHTLFFVHSCPTPTHTCRTFPAADDICGVPTKGAPRPAVSLVGNPRPLQCGSLCFLCTPARLSAPTCTLSSLSHDAAISTNGSTSGLASAASSDSSQLKCAISRSSIWQ
jgi:hypothetical protein